MQALRAPTFLTLFPAPQVSGHFLAGSTSVSAGIWERPGIFSFCLFSKFVSATNHFIFSVDYFQFSRYISPANTSNYVFYSILLL